MSWLVESYLGFHNWWNKVSQYKASLKQSPSPIRLGVLSAAAINYTAIFDPAESHPDVIISGIAARSQSRAQAQKTKYSLSDAKVYASYDELINDKEIDAVYIPLPNGLHAEWTIKALEAGKHVLVEKPIASNAEQVDLVAEAVKRTGKVALEAFHWRFHPAGHLVSEIIGSGEYGRVKSVHSRAFLTAGVLPKDDIRFNYDLAGGTAMDLTYVFSSVCRFAAPEIGGMTFEVKEAIPRVNALDKRIDEAIKATIEIVPGKGKEMVECTIEADLAQPKILGIIPKVWDSTPTVRIECEKAQVVFNNFVLPWIMHSVVITPKDGEGKLLSRKKITKKLYTGGPLWGDGRGMEWWSTYRYQLEGFIDVVRAVDGGASATDVVKGPWVSLEESKKVMEVIDAVYEKAGMPKRGL